MIVLSNVKKLYDGATPEKASVRSGVDVWIDGGKIKEVKPHAKPAGTNGLTVVDCSELTVTPGLIDCHNHITILGLASKDVDLMNGQTMLLWVEKILHTTLVDGGVTTTRDIGGATQQMKRLVDEGVVIGPRLKIAIAMLSSTGGHADWRGPDRCHAEISKLWPEAPGRPSSIVDGPWECRKRVREIAASGADLIKICASPGIASPTDHLEHREFTADEIQAITDEAAHRGLRVAAHAHSRSGIDLAIKHGVHDLQHISFMEERQVDEAHKKGCTVTPTSWVIHALTESKDLTPFVMEKVKRCVEHHGQATSYAAKGGLKILGGSDPVLRGMHGKNYRELVHLIREGLKPLAAWHGMTGLAAHEIGQQDTGTITAGQRADLLFCKGDVLENPGLFDQGALLEVMKDGVGYRGGLASLPQRRFEHTVRDLV